MSKAGARFSLSIETLLSSSRPADFLTILLNISDLIPFVYHPNGLTLKIFINKTRRSAFILNVACREAENVLLDRRLFQLEAEPFNAFNKALDKPLPKNKRLKELLSEPSPWEK